MYYAHLRNLEKQFALELAATPTSPSSRGDGENDDVLMKRNPLAFNLVSIFSVESMHVIYLIISQAIDIWCDAHTY
jgi:hypothetical protein